MSTQGFPYSEEELSKAGLVGEGVSPATQSTIDFMKKRPDLLKLSIFALQCLNAHSGQTKDLASPPSPVWVTTKAIAVSPYAPDEYEKNSYYNGITGDGNHPVLIYRSNYSTSFPKPSGRHAHLPIKTLRGVFDTPLNVVWPIIAPEICNILRSFNVHGWSVDLARFFTHGSGGGEVQGSLGPIVIWIGVPTNTISSDTSHEMAQAILTLLHKNNIDNVVVEFREDSTQPL